MKKHKLTVPYIEQSGQTECGLCSLAMILSYYKCEYTVSEFREKWNVARDGLSLLTLKEIAGDLKFISKGYRITNINNILTPSIIHIRNNHFVVIEKVRKGYVRIVDPAKGKYNLTFEELAQENIGLALYIEPSSEIKIRRVKSNILDYSIILKHEKSLIFIILIATFMIQILSLIIPIGIKYIINNLIQLEGDTLLSYLGIVILAIIFINCSMTFIKSRILVKLQMRFDEKLSAQFVKKILNLPFNFFQRMSTGDLVHRYTGTVIIREMLSNRIVSIWLDLGLVIMLLIYMWISSIKLALIVTVMSIIQVLISIISINKNKKLQSKEVSEQANTTKYFTEIAKAATIVKVKGAENIVYDKWSKMFLKQLNAMKVRGNFMAIISCLNQTIQFATPLLILWIGINQVYTSKITIGEMFSFYTISTIFLAPISSIILTLNDLIYANAYFNRMLEILHLNEENNINTGVVLDELKGNILVENVSFKYGIHSPYTLKNININIKEGEFIAIVGETGSGKSSLATLLLGLEAPSAGNIYFEGINLNKINKEKLRQKIGIVTQDMYLFNQSIKDNIIFGASNVDFTHMEKACKIAEIYDEIVKMPMGFETILAENGVNISGGQRQRIALARALINMPSILLLDEATSSLDTITEEKIRYNLEKLYCTKIVIAHRLSTIITADKVIVLEKGMIKEIGTHKELINTSSYYRKLYEKNMELKK